MYVSMRRKGAGAGRAIVAASALLAVALVALVAVNSAPRRTELTYGGALIAETNPALGSGKGGWGTGPNDLESFYTMEAPDVPNANQGGWQTATTQQINPDDPDAGAVYQYGHGPDWIYADGPSGGPIRGSASNYFNEYRTDPDLAVGATAEQDTYGDMMVANEQSRPDHTTSEPYTSAASDLIAPGYAGVNAILDFDPYLMKSNGIYKALPRAPAMMLRGP